MSKRSLRHVSLGAALLATLFTGGRATGAQRFPPAAFTPCTIAKVRAHCGTVTVY